MSMMYVNIGIFGRSSWVSPPMPPALPSLEARRTELLRALGDLHDMRRGSIVGATFRCRKPNCHCSRLGDPGHGPIMRLT